MKQYLDGIKPKDSFYYFLKAQRKMMDGIGVINTQDGKYVRLDMRPVKHIPVLTPITRDDVQDMTKVYKDVVWIEGKPFRVLKKGLYSMSRTIAARKYIYERCKKIDNTEWYVSRLDYVSDWYIMPKYALLKLSDKEILEYIKYATYTLSENAGGYDGWATAQRELEKFGFKKVERHIGHRCFVKLEWTNYDHK